VFTREPLEGINDEFEGTMLNPGPEYEGWSVFSNEVIDRKVRYD